MPLPARILLTQPIHPQAQARLAELGAVVVAPDTTQDTLRRCAAGCAVVVVRARLPDGIFAAAPSLVGAVRHGSGVDMIPIAAATEHGVLVANVPGVNAPAVAEHVLRSMLALARGSALMAARLQSRSAGWGARAPLPTQVSSCTAAASAWSGLATWAARLRACVALASGCWCRPIPVRRGPRRTATHAGSGCRNCWKQATSWCWPAR